MKSDHLSEGSHTNMLVYNMYLAHGPRVAMRIAVHVPVRLPVVPRISGPR